MTQHKTIRFLAYQLVYKVLIRHLPSNKLLDQTIRENNLSAEDKALLTQIVYGTIKQKLVLEQLLIKVLSNLKINNKIKIILMISLYQKLFLDSIPDYAIVNEAVKVAKIYDQKLGNFVNFALRKLLKEAKNNEELDFLIRYNFPQWLWNHLKTQYDEVIIDKLVITSMDEPKISARVNFNKISRAQLAEKYPQYCYDISKVAKHNVIYHQEVISSPMFQKGEIILQDEMSSKIVEILDPQSGDKILDMCSAPGGKTTYIAELNYPEIVDAYDISEKKIKLIKENALRLGINNIKYYVLDSRKIVPVKLYDRVLLDAPCSGMGVWKRKPEIKYLEWTPEKWQALFNLQQELLENAYRLLKPQGILVYSTCTFNLKENEQQISQFIKKHSKMNILEEQQIFGFENNTDGFYWCKMKKNVTLWKRDNN